MGLISVNTVKKYRCDNCRKESEWNNEWLSKTILRATHGGWDEDITVCSSKCAFEFDNKRKKNRTVK